MAAQIRFRDTSGTLRTLNRLRARDEGGNLRTIQTVKVRDTTGSLRIVFQYLKVALSAYAWNKQFNSPPPHSQDAAISVSTTGGTGPFAYAWSSDSPNGTYANTPSASSTTFNGSVAPGDNAQAEWVCTVTDGTGASATSPVCLITINGV